MIISKRPQQAGGKAEAAAKGVEKTGMGNPEWAMGKQLGKVSKIQQTQKK